MEWLKNKMYSMYKFTFTVLLLVVFNTIAFQQTINKEELINSLSGQSRIPRRWKSIISWLSYTFMKNKMTALYIMLVKHLSFVGCCNEDILPIPIICFVLFYRQLSDNERLSIFSSKGTKAVMRKSAIVQKAARTLEIFQEFFRSANSRMLLEYLFGSET